MTLIANGCAAQRTIIDNSGARAVSTSDAFVFLGPGSPAVLSVVESPYANATRQTIALETHGRTPGENQLRVDILGLTNTGVTAETTLPDRPLNEAGLYAEGQEALPNVPLRLSLSYVQNRYGPFGYLVGRTPQGDTCVYAWQRVATPDQRLSLVNARATVSVRLRLCDPKADEAALIATMMNLGVNVRLSGGSWTPDPKGLSPDIGAAGTLIAPPSIMAAAANPYPSAPSPATTPSRAKHAKRAPLPEPAPAASAAERPAAVVAVPPPPLASLNEPPPVQSAPSPQPLNVPPPRDAQP
jgi:Cellulose biosynthesis protein BcsN